MKWLIWIAGILVFVAAIILIRRRLRDPLKRTVVSAVIDIYPSGSHHVEFLPTRGVEYLDLVQLAVSYLSNVIYVTYSDPPSIKQGLLDLIGIFRKEENLSDEEAFRQVLSQMAETAQPSLLDSGRLATGESERYRVRLIRGHQFDYSISDFSMHGYKPNLAKSGLYLFDAVTQRLPNNYLRLMQESFAMLVLYYEEHEPEMLGHQSDAYRMVRIMMERLAELFDNKE